MSLSNGAFSDAPGMGGVALRIEGHHQWHHNPLRLQFMPSPLNAAIKRKPPQLSPVVSQSCPDLQALALQESAVPACMDEDGSGGVLMLGPAATGAAPLSGGVQALRASSRRAYKLQRRSAPPIPAEPGSAAAALLCWPRSSADVCEDAVVGGGSSGSGSGGGNGDGESALTAAEKRGARGGASYFDGDPLFATSFSTAAPSSSANSACSDGLSIFIAAPSCDSAAAAAAAPWSPRSTATSLPPPPLTPLTLPADLYGSTGCAVVETGAPVRLCEGPTWDPAAARAAAAASAGLEAGFAPILAEGCASGTYYLRGASGRMCAIFKPMDEEPGAPNTPHAAYTREIKEGISSGAGAVRECAARVVDGGVAGVPPTAMARARINGSIKIGSLQVYVHHDCSAEDMGPSLYSTRDVQEIAMLDIRLCNQDRHVGNLLVATGGSGDGDDGGDGCSGGGSGGSGSSRRRLVPIDHGYCLPRPLATGEADFAWLRWRQAAAPLPPAARARIAALDGAADAARLAAALPQLPRDCLLTLRIGTAALQRGVARGLTLAEIGGAMTRAQPDAPSALEGAVAAAAAACGGGVTNHDAFMAAFAAPLEAMVEACLAQRADGSGGGGSGGSGGGSSRSVSATAAAEHE